VIRHVVLWKLKAEDEAGKAKAFTEIAEGLESLIHVIPELKSLTVDRNMAYGDVNFDAVLIAKYENLAGLEAYQSHPAHKIVGAMIRERVVERASIDVEY